MQINDYDWPNLTCNWCRSTKADVLYNDEPLCCVCADSMLEREVAIHMHPGLAELLPPLRER